MAADSTNGGISGGTDRGATTPEYVVGTVAAAGFATVLIQFLTSPVARNVLWMLMRKALGLD